MGIPTCFRYLFEKYSNAIIQINNKPHPYIYDYFFIDFNSICYNCYYDNPNVSKDIFISKIFDSLWIMSSSKSKKVSLYFSRWTDSLCRIHQQRSRRFKNRANGCLSVVIIVVVINIPSSCTRYRIYVFPNGLF